MKDVLLKLMKAGSLSILDSVCLTKSYTKHIWCMLACYKSRTLTLIDIPITFYIDSDHNRLDKREGGEFCVDRSTISRIAFKKSFTFDCDALIQFLTKKFAGRTIAGM